MNIVRRVLKAFWADESGSVAVEYALIAALVAVAVIPGVALLGVNISALFSAVAACLSTTGAGCMSLAP